MIYLDNASTTFPKPECVYDAVDKYNRTNAVNAGRGVYAKAVEASRMVQEAKELLLELCDERFRGERDQQRQQPLSVLVLLEQQVLHDQLLGKQQHLLLEGSLRRNQLLRHQPVCRSGGTS